MTSVNETRLQQALLALTLLYPDVAQVLWSTSTNGWTLKPEGTCWEFVAPTMDECVEQFIAKLRAMTTDAVEERRKRYDQALDAQRAVEAALR
jgi:hypothetical protein